MNTVLVKPMVLKPYGDPQGFPRHPPKCQFPGRFFPTVNVLSASCSFFTTHCTAVTPDKSYSPRRRFKRDCVTRLAFKAQPKLIAVNLPLFVKCQVELFLCPIVMSLILKMYSFGMFACLTKQSI